MYKELASSLKSYKPSSEQMNSIKSRFNKSSFIHSGDNLFGEMYEVWVYEYLKSWALQCPDVSSFVCKEDDSLNRGSDCLTYDKNGQIIFIQNGRKAAEYDGLFIYKNRIVFVESSVSELRSYYRKLEDRVVLKRELLVEYFKTEEVYYLVVTRPKKRALVYRSLPHLVLYTLKNPDFSEIGSYRVSCNNVVESQIKLVDLATISSFSSSF